MQSQHPSTDQHPAKPVQEPVRSRLRLHSPLLIMAAVFLVLTILTGLVVYALQQDRVNKLQAQIQSLEAQQSQEASKLPDAIQSDKFQAVFLNVPGTPAGQVYLGHLSLLDKDNYKLTDVYYLSDSGTLVKLGNEPHKPQNVMYIPKSTVLFWENLKDAKQFNGELK